MSQTLEDFSDSLYKKKQIILECFLWIKVALP